MTMFVGSRDMVGFIRTIGPETVLGELVGMLERDFARWERFELVPRLASHSELGVIELMPTSDGHHYAFKYVNGHPGNPARGLQTVTAFGALAEVATGYPILIAEMTLLTALRTAATSALASRCLARSDARRMAMIGAGSQAVFQALGHRAALGINELSLWDVDPQTLAKARDHLVGLGFEVRVADDGAESVRGADIVTTCTADKARATVLFDASVEPGMHLNAIGGDCPGKTELEPSILGRAGVFVEHTPQTRIEGEIQLQAPDFPVTELWTVIAGAAAGRQDTEQVTIFDSVGFAVEDFTALSYVHQRAAATGHATEIDLVADPDDPKDLFALIAGSRG